MFQNLPDHRRVLDAGDHPDLATALLAALDLDTEHALEPLCPAHGTVPLGRRTQVRRRDLPSPFRRDLRPPPTVRCEHAVISRLVSPRFRHQRHQPRHEVQRLEHHVRGAVTVRRLQRVAHLALGGERQTTGGNGRPGDVAAQSLDLLSVIGTGRYAGVQGETVGAGEKGLGGFGQQRARQALQREGLLPRPRTQRNPVGDRVAEQAVHCRALPGLACYRKGLLPNALECYIVVPQVSRL